MGGGASLVPGLIHSLKADGGAKTITNFTNYNTCEREILWAFRIIGVWGFATGLSLIYLSTREGKSAFYSKVLKLFIIFQLMKTLFLIGVAKITGNGTESVAPEAPGNWTPFISIILHILTLMLL